MRCCGGLFMMLVVGCPGAWAATLCDDLSAVAETVAVDYGSQIQPIFDTYCAGCHTAGGAQGELRLDGSVSFANLVGVRATAINMPRVDPGVPGNSFLMQKINCDQPDAGSRMPQNGRLSLSLQARVRDWIAQGAQAAATANQPPQAAADSASTAFGEPLVVDVLANDIDPDGDALSLVAVEQPAYGQVEMVAEGVRYTPAFGFSGLDSFRYQVSDGEAGSSAEVRVEVAAAPFELNFGLSGSWFNPETDGQGFVFEVVPEDRILVVYWYTYAMDGQGGQQWLVGAGPFNGNRALVDLQRPGGGRFDQPGGVERQAWGQVEVGFTSCTEGWLRYRQDSDGLSGEIPMVRITADPMCQAVLDQGGSGR